MAEEDHQNLETASGPSAADVADLLGVAQAPVSAIVRHSLLRRAMARPLVVGYAALFAALGLCAGAIAIFGDAHDGEPVVSLALEPFAENASGVMGSVTRVNFSRPRLVDGKLVSDPALMENTSEGPLPKIAADNRMPMSAFAGDYERSTTRPKIAVVIAGLGISEIGRAHV